MTKYELIIYWSARDEAFLVEVPELPGCMADGGTREEARARLIKALRDTVVLGPTTNRHFLIRLLEHAEFAALARAQTSRTSSGVLSGITGPKARPVRGSTDCDDM